ncbi:hypothetical protein PI23P_09940 [Polaribacter irgensii 23-P]|uniref:Uncharacterized protein n=1 Tax=Polaribacter irgensii 23-P TaxID=313594 RepID=A4C0J7_9FLAO|nr:hypothetical protein PI23P_09940 [Polaribacter irgensii 23-P]
MPILAFLILFLGFYALYNTSKKVVLQKNNLVLWIQKHVLISKITGMFCLSISFYLYRVHYGFRSGICIALVALMVVGSLVVLLFPLFTSKKN